MAKKDKKLLVLLDAHAIIHRAYHALPEFLSSKGEPTGALYGLANMLMKIITDLKPDYLVACYDLPQKTFRHEAYEKYKASRAKTDEALVTQLKNSRKIFEAFGIPIYDAPGFEADDILGTIVEQIKIPRLNLGTIIASGDMDTLQLVDDKEVQVFTLKKGINDTILYDEKKVFERFGFPPKLLPDFKGLRGDPSDNIIGVKGIGEKTAAELVVNFGSIENLYKTLKKNPAAIRKIGIKERILKILQENEEEALFSKTLAEIRRDAPIHFELPEKTFWQNINSQKVEEIFSEFEFRSLLARLKNFFQQNDSGAKNFLESAPSEAKGQGIHTILENSSLPGDKFQETAIALWLLNSELTNPALEDILLFARTRDFEKAREFIFRKLKEEKLEKVYEEIEKPIIPVVKKMEDRGILVDREYFEKLSTEYHRELDKLAEKIHHLAGTEFNLNSPQQLAEVLFEKMGMKPKGKRRRLSTGRQGSFSTRIEVLEELEEKNPIIKEILLYRELQKLLSTYADVIPKMTGADGRLHAKFLQNGTSTGRFSSQNPNLQNLPIKTDLGRRIRGGFIAPKGKILAAFDYSQIELRVAALLSGDPKMTAIFEQKKDIHTGVASFVFEVPMEKVNAEMRRRAKVINFGIIYGMGISALRKNLGGDREEAQKFYDNYFRQFSGIRNYLESVKKFVAENKFTLTLFGRRRFFPNINSRIPFLRNMAERTALNAPIQGTAADLIKLAVRFAEEDLAEAGLLEKTCLILQIHDELVYEIEETVLSKSAEIIKKAMEKALERSFLPCPTSIPLLVHFASGRTLEALK